MLVLCFNLTLAHRLRRLVGERCAEYGANPTLVTCTSFHTFCARIVDDAAAAGVVAAEPERGTWPEKIVARTEEVLRSGFECRFDAVLVDEGQDFRVQWWNLVRELVLRDGGEMLLTTDPTVDSQVVDGDYATRTQTLKIQPLIVSRIVDGQRIACIRRRARRGAAEKP